MLAPAQTRSAFLFALTSKGVLYGAADSCEDLSGGCGEHSVGSARARSGNERLCLYESRYKVMTYRSLLTKARGMNITMRSGPHASAAPAAHSCHARVRSATLSRCWVRIRTTYFGARRAFPSIGADAEVKCGSQQFVKAIRRDRISEGAGACIFGGSQFTRTVTRITSLRTSIKQDDSNKVATSAGCHETIKNQGIGRAA